MTKYYFCDPRYMENSKFSLVFFVVLHCEQEIVFKKDKATLHVTSKICENTINFYN